MNLIDVYLDEVGKHLPAKQRADIQAEIRSALQDMLDEQARQSGRAPEEDELVLEVLQAYGSPHKVAAGYQPERYLIGPRLYPAFERTVQIALPIMGALALVGLGVALARVPLTPDSIVSAIIEALAGLAGSLVSVLGSIVLVYAILERTVPDLKLKPDDWDARSLTKVSPPDRVTYGETVTNLVFILAALVIFNFFSHILGITFQQGESWTTLPVLSEDFWRYLPALNLLWVAQIVLHLGLLYRGQWNSLTRWYALLVHGLEVGIAVVMLQGPSLIGVTVDQLMLRSPLPADLAQLLVTMFQITARVTLVIIIVVGLIEIARLGWKLLSSRRVPVLVNS